MKAFLILIFTMHCYAVKTHYELESLNFESADDITHSGENEPDLFDITADDLSSNNSSSGSIDDLLKTSPMATTARGPRSSSESPQVRGLDNNKIFVMVDGSRQRFQSAHNSMIGIDTENIKAIDIYKSSSDTNFSQSLGGGVNFITLDPEDLLKRKKNTANEFKLKFNSANSEKAINAKTALRKNNLSSLVSVSYADAKDLKLSNDKTLGNSSYRDFSALGKVKFKNLGLKLEHFSRDDDSPIDGSLNPPSDDKYKSLFSKNETIRNNLSLSFNKRNTINANLYLNQYKQVKVKEGFVDTRNLTTTGLTVSKNLSGLNFGLDTFFDNLNSDRDGKSISSYPKAKSNNSNLFISKDIDLSKRLKLVLNAKQHFYSLTSKTNKVSANKMTKGIRLNYKVQNNLNLTSSYSEGFNSPRVNEMYAEGLHSKGDWFIPDNYFITNESLVEETSKHYEIGANYKKELFNSNALLDIQANLYQSDLKNYIYMNRLDFEGTTQFINIPKAELSGAELSVNYLYDIYDFKLSYSSVRGENLTRDIYLEDLPADNFNFQFKYDLERYSLTLGYLGHLSLEQDRVNPQTLQRTDPTPSYYVHNVFVNKSFKDFDLGLRIDNLGNKEYRKHASHLYESEQDIKLSIKYRIDKI